LTVPRAGDSVHKTEVLSGISGDRIGGFPFQDRARPLAPGNGDCGLGKGLGQVPDKLPGNDPKLINWPGFEIGPGPIATWGKSTVRLLDAFGYNFR
jgi:hypothetical protein